MLILYYLSSILFNKGIVDEFNRDLLIGVSLIIGSFSFFNYSKKFTYICLIIIILSFSLFFLK